MKILLTSSIPNPLHHSFIEDPERQRASRGSQAAGRAGSYRFIAGDYCCHASEKATINAVWLLGSTLLCCSGGEQADSGCMRCLCMCWAAKLRSISHTVKYITPGDLSLKMKVLPNKKQVLGLGHLLGGCNWKLQEPRISLLLLRGYPRSSVPMVRLTDLLSPVHQRGDNSCSWD